MYGLLTPREPVNEKLGWLDNPNNIGLLSAALGILANNTGHYGALGPPLGAGGLLGLQGAMGTRQQNLQNQRNNRRDSQAAAMNNERLNLLKREFGLKEEDRARSVRAAGLIGNVLSGGGESGNVADIFPQQQQHPAFVPEGTPLPAQNVPVQGPQFGSGAVQPWSTGTGVQPGIMGAQQVSVPTHEVVGAAPWQAIDAQIIQMDDLVKQYPEIASDPVYQETYKRLQENRKFLSQQGEVKTLGDGFFYQEGMSRPYVWDEKGEKRYVSSKEIQELGLKRAAAGAARLENKVNAFLPASEEIQKEQAKDLKENYKILRGAPAMIKNLSRARSLVPKAGAFLGSFGEAKLAIAKFFNNNLGTKIDPNGIASAEELRTSLFQQTMENLKKLDAQPSEYQQRIMMESFGSLNTDPNALPKVMDVFEEIVRDKVDEHNRNVREAKKNNIKFLYDPTIEMPERGSAETQTETKKPKNTSGLPKSKQFTLDDGSKVFGTLDPATGEYYVTRNGKKYRIEE